MRSARPAGFVFLTVCALACACVMAAALAAPDFPPVARFSLAATGALALVVAEALAFVRPWAFGASIAFAGTFIAMLFVVTLDAEALIFLVCITAFFILVALS
ncbi:MAG: hypothetical protein ACJ8J0_21255, partial [Longimicrobiaceae bacterium]